MLNNLCEIIKRYDINNITHIGSTDGSELLFIDNHNLNNNFQFHAYEPNPYWHDKIKNEKFILHKKAVGNSIINPYLYVINHKESNYIGCTSLLKRLDDWGDMIKEFITTIKVDIIKGVDIPIPDLLIIDAEGMSFDILNSFEENIKKIKIITMECEHSEIFENSKLYTECSNYLINNEFQQVFIEYPYKNQSNSIWIKK